MRTRTAAEQRGKMGAALQASGPSHEEFARRHKSNVGTLRSWIYRPSKTSSLHARPRCAPST